MPTETIAQRMQRDRLFYGSLIPEEILVLETWLESNHARYTKLEFDVHIGLGRDPGSLYSDADRQGWIRKTQKRIDAVLWQDTFPTLVEVKRRATPSALGQLITYRNLWLAEGRSVRIPSLLLICANCDPDLQLALSAEQIETAQVSPDWSRLREPTRDRKGGVNP